VNRYGAVLRWLTVCTIAIALIAEWPLALALSSRHLAGIPAAGGILTASLCISATPGQAAADHVPGGPAHGAAKGAPCPICQGLQTHKAPAPAEQADVARHYVAARIVSPEPSAPVQTVRLESKHPRGPPIA